MRINKEKLLNFVVGCLFTFPIFTMLNTSSADLIPPSGERSWLSVRSNWAGSIRGIFAKFCQFHMFYISARELIFNYMFLIPLIKYVIRSVTGFSAQFCWGLKWVGSTQQAAASARKEAVQVLRRVF